MQTTITHKNEHGEYTVTVNKTDMTLKQIMEELVRPVLAAATFPESALIEWFEEPITNASS